MKIATPPEKSHPPLSQQHPSKSWDPVKTPLFLKIWLEAQTSPPAEPFLGSGVHTMAWSMQQHHIPQNNFFESFTSLLDLWLGWQHDSVLLTVPGIYPQIYHKAPWLLMLLFVKGSNKQQSRDRFISNFPNGQNLSSLMISKCSWG